MSPVTTANCMTDRAEDVRLGGETVYEFCNKLILLTIKAVLIGELLGKTRPIQHRVRYVYLGGWSLHKMEILGKRAERKYIEHYSSHVLPTIRAIKIPGTKLIRRPRKPK